MYVFKFDTLYMFLSMVKFKDDMYYESQKYGKVEFMIASNPIPKRIKPQSGQLWSDIPVWHFSYCKIQKEIDKISFALFSLYHFMQI